MTFRPVPFFVATTCGSCRSFQCSITSIYVANMMPCRFFYHRFSAKHPRKVGWRVFLEFSAWASGNRTKGNNVKSTEV